MFTYYRNLKSGIGTVGLHEEGSTFYATLWTEDDDRFVVIENAPYEGLKDRQVARRLMRDYVDSYALTH